jgi:hypothetical protein
MKYRILWTWDSLMFADTIPQMTAQQSNPGSTDGPTWTEKTSKAAYLAHFKSAMEFAADHKFNGYIIWGFIRDESGGRRELSHYARTQGVRVLPGVCTENAYGGFTFSRESRFNLDNWTAQHPELRFKHPTEPIEPGLCPSKPQNIQWLREGTKWFFDNLPDVGGMNLENGDWMLCSTDDCNAARSKEGADHNFLWDQLQTYRPVLEEAGKLRPDAWMIFATYIGFTESDFQAEMQTARKRGFATSANWPPQLLQSLPGNGIAQWTLTNQATNFKAYWPEGAPLPSGKVRQHIGLLHQGSIWGAATDASRWWAAPGGTLDEISPLLAQVCTRGVSSGLDGLVMKGRLDRPALPMN